MAWTVHKFGGTSVADASCFRRVAAIAAGETTPRLAIVGSAMRGTTGDLLGLIDSATRGESVDGRLAALGERYRTAAVDLLGAEGARSLLERHAADLTEIDSILKALSLVR